MKNQFATFAGGCFWCTEALFTRLKGVVSVLPGYSGGTIENPTYEQVCTGSTGHAEAIQIEFDSSIVPYEVLLEIFFHTHDPTTLNRQGADVGTQYRSAIFYHNTEQRLAAEQMIQRLNKDSVFRGTIVTEVVPFTTFYEAEDYHKNYFEKNSYQPYCNMVIEPKVRKLQELYRDKLTDKYKNE